MNDKETGRLVCLKTMLKRERADHVKFFVEISLWSQLAHPYIIKLHQFFDTPNTMYFLLECYGRDLYEEISSAGCFQEPMACRLTWQLLCAVQYLHERRICHRDIKPENILYDGRAGTIKLTDFGSAVLVAQPDDSITDCAGTPGYVAPEVLALPPSYGLKADVWSAGVISFIILSGSPPFWDSDDVELCRLTRRGSFEFQGEVWRQVGAPAQHFIRTILTVDPARRPSAEEMSRHPWLSFERHALVPSDAASALPTAMDVGVHTAPPGHQAQEPLLVQHELKDTLLPLEGLATRRE